MKQQSENTTLQVGSVYQYRDGNINLLEVKDDAIFKVHRFMKPKIMILDIGSSKWSSERAAVDQRDGPTRFLLMTRLSMCDFLTNHVKSLPG